MVSSGRTDGRARTEATRRRRGGLHRSGPAWGGGRRGGQPLLRPGAPVVGQQGIDGGTVPLILSRENGCEAGPDVACARPEWASAPTPSVVRACTAGGRSRTGTGWT